VRDEHKKTDKLFQLPCQLTTFVGLNANADAPQSPGCRHCEPVTPQWRGFYKKKHGCFVIDYHFIADYIKPYFSISYQKCFLGGNEAISFRV